jgi:membrane fusion protein (multidrug efflux system)
MLKQSYPKWLTFILAICLTVSCSDKSNQSKSQTKRPPPKVGIVDLKPQRVTLLTELPGRTKAYRVAKIRPQVTGVIEKRYFKQGDQVDAGQKLYKINPDPYLAALQEAKADLDQARASINSIRQKKQRLEALVKKGAVSQQKYDNAQSRLKKQQAKIDTAKSNLKTARINLDYTSVEAPIQGRIGPEQVTQGALVTANQNQHLVRITRLDPIYVDFQFSITKWNNLKTKLKKGQLTKIPNDKARVKLIMAHGQSYRYPGKLKAKSFKVNSNTDSVTLRARFPNPEHSLLPGMYVRVEFQEGIYENAIVAPQQGVTHNRQGKPTAMVVNDANKVSKRQLKVERAIGSFWLVKDGLKTGDRLVVSGLQKIKPGQKVKPVSANIPNKPSNEQFKAQSKAKIEAH